ncbi:MAG TPA: hypothetical protein VFH73_04460 [Polyangia bacterium]|jgi:hypothetical protein|nr:hypothetical protein [Polyangia bacterium]
MTRGRRAGRARVATLAGLAALTLWSGLSQAQEPATAPSLPRAPSRLQGATFLDDRAAAFAAIKPTDLADGFALMDLLGGIFPDVIGAFARVRDGLGLYAFSRGELMDNGVAPDALVLASLGAAEAEEATAKKKGGAHHFYVRHRFVLQLTDGDKFLRSATAILASSSSGLISIGIERPAGPPPKWANDVKALAKRQGVRLLARLRDGALVAVRRSGDFAIVDYADPWGAGAVDPNLDNARLLQKMVAAPRQRLSDGLKQGARKLLDEEETSIALVIEPNALAPLFPRAACRKEWTSSEGALIDDAALLLRLHPFQWRLEIAWSLSELGRSRLAAAADDDGLLDAGAATGDGIAAASLLVGSLDVFRAAPRPPLFAGNVSRARQSLAGCGPVAAVALASRFWPHLVALEVEGRAARLGAASLLPALRNIAAVLRGIPSAKQSWEALTVVFASVPSSAGEALGNLLSQQAGGRSEKQRLGDRTPTFYDLAPATGFSEAGVERIAGHHDALALTPQSSGLGWYYRMARRPARFGPQVKIGALSLNLAALLESQAETADEGTRAAVRMAASQLGQLGGNLTLDADRELLRLQLNLSANQ